MDTTCDGLLDKRLWLQQPAKGYRIAFDTIFLAAAVPAHPGAHGIECGCGVGGALLALACRIADLTLEGLEIQPELVDLCQTNIARNRSVFSPRTSLSARQGDIGAIHQGTFSDWQGQADFVLANPPFHHFQTHPASQNKIKQTANTESLATPLRAWLQAAAYFLKEGGCLTLIHRADRLDEIRKSLEPMRAWQRVQFRLIAPRKDAQPSRILLWLTKGIKKGALVFEETAAPFILHQENGAYTKEAEKILRGLAPFPMFDEIDT